MVLSTERYFIDYMFVCFLCCLFFLTCKGESLTGHRADSGLYNSCPTCQQNLCLPVHSAYKSAVEQHETWRQTRLLLLRGPGRPEPTPREMNPVVKDKMLHEKQLLTND